MVPVKSPADRKTMNENKIFELDDELDKASAAIKILIKDLDTKTILYEALKKTSYWINNCRIHLDNYLNIKKSEE